MQLFQSRITVIILQIRQKACDQIHKADHDHGHRLQNDHQRPHGSGKRPGKTGGVLFGRDLGNRLAENNNGNGDHKCRDPGVFFTEYCHHSKGSHGRCRNIDKIIADQDGGKRVIKTLADFYGNGCLLVTVVTLVLQSDPAAGRIGHFRCRKEGRTGDTEDDSGYIDIKIAHLSSPPLRSTVFVTERE